MCYLKAKKSLMHKQRCDMKGRGCGQGIWNCLKSHRWPTLTSNSSYEDVKWAIERHISKESSQTCSTERKQKKVFKNVKFYQLKKFKDRCQERCMPPSSWPRNVEEKFHSRVPLNALLCSSHLTDWTSKCNWEQCWAPQKIKIGKCNHFNWVSLMLVSLSEELPGGGECILPLWYLFFLYYL